MGRIKWVRLKGDIPGKGNGKPLVSKLESIRSVKGPVK